MRPHRDSPAAMYDLGRADERIAQADRIAALEARLASAEALVAKLDGADSGYCYLCHVIDTHMGDCPVRKHREAYPEPLTQPA